MTQREKLSTRETTAKEYATGALVRRWSCDFGACAALSGAEVDRLASARSPSAAATPATTAALMGRTG
jgi:hypothetical protein